MGHGGEYELTMRLRYAPPVKTGKNVKQVVHRGVVIPDRIWNDPGPDSSTIAQRVWNSPE